MVTHEKGYLLIIFIIIFALSIVVISMLLIHNNCNYIEIISNNTLETSKSYYDCGWIKLK